MTVSPSIPPVKGTRPDVRLYPVSEIKVSPDRVRKDMGDLDELAESIRRLNLLQPVGLDPDAVLIFGERRLLACRDRLGWTDIPVIFCHTIDDVAAATRAERDENRCRKEFTPTELVESGRRLEALEQPAAAERKKATQAKKGEKVGGQGAADSAAPVAKGETRQKVAKALGVSHDTYTKAKRVVEAAEQEPETFGDLPGVMEAESVHAAHAELKRRARPKPAVPIEIEEPEHTYADLMGDLTALAAKVTRYAGGDDDDAARLRQCLTWCGLMEYTPARYADGVHHPAKVRFLPLAGVRAVVEAAGLPGRRKTEAEIVHIYQVASGGFVPPAVLRRRKQRAAAKAVRS